LNKQNDRPLPKISIGLPVYNGQRFIKKKLDTILAQSYTNFELIISDNASTDLTSKICEEYAKTDKRILYFRQKKNMGIRWNFNFVLEQAKSDYFVWAAVDDVWFPIFLEKCINVFLSKKNVVGCNSLVSPYNLPEEMKSEKVDFYFQNFLRKIRFSSKSSKVISLSGSYEKKVCDFLITEKKVKNCNIVEIGCGKGTFLRKLVEDKTWNNRGYGFDPSYEGPETDLEGRLNFEKRYYDLDCTHIDADIIICRHVIEHVPDPLHLLRIARNALKNSKIGKIFFETPSLEWILRNQVIYDFSYEHCNYFSANSLKTAFEKTGFTVENIKSIFEEQHLWLEAKSSSEKIEVTQNPDPIPNLAKKFGTMEKELTKKWKLKIQELAEKGKVAIWGAGGKGVTFVNLVDPYRKWIDSVIDLNYNKQGNYLPGTGHPIISYKQISSRKIMAAILMNPNYYDETVKLLNKSKINIDLIQ